MESATVLALETFLGLVQGLLAEFGTNVTTTTIDNIIQSLLNLIPIITADASNFLTPIKNIIAALQSSGNVTPAQITQLQTLDAQVDAAYDASATQAGV